MHQEGTLRMAATGSSTTYISKADGLSSPDEQFLDELNSLVPQTMRAMEEEKQKQEEHASNVPILGERGLALHLMLVG